MGIEDATIVTRSSSRPGITPISPPEGVAPDALRFFARAGLLSDASPGADVTPEFRERVRFVQRAQQLGFELHEIRNLLAIDDGVTDSTTPPLAAVGSQIETIEQRIIALMRVRGALLQTRERLERRRLHSPCPIMAALQVDSRE
jgi:MerR family mercuric resistance operon transcriptional regulator